MTVVQTKRSHWFQAVSKIHSGKLKHYLVSRSGNNYLCLVALPSELKVLSATLSLPWKLSCICSWVALSACFLFVEFWECDRLHCILSVFINPSWQCFYCIKFLRIFWISHVWNKDSLQIIPFPFLASA